MRLTAVHTQRLACAVQAAMRNRDRDFALVCEQEDGCARKLVWYDGATRNVILAGEGQQFDRLVQLARAEFAALFLAALHAPTGAVLAHGEREDAMEESRR